MNPLIYIEQKDKEEAGLLLRGFSNSDIRQRVYINALGAELVMKYLANENINIANVYNMHNIFKIREEFDIADIMLPNIHIDVRMVYDENIIFIPKSHFEYNLTPDIYAVCSLAQDASYVNFVGFFSPEDIDKSLQNDKYYFIDKDNLKLPSEFIDFVKNYTGNTTESFSEDLYTQVLSFADNDISEWDKKSLIKLLKKSSSLREEMIEFDNFEWLSYNASKEDIIENSIPQNIAKDEFNVFEEEDDFADSGLEMESLDVPDLTLDEQPLVEETLIVTGENETPQPENAQEPAGLNVENEISDSAALSYGEINETPLDTSVEMEDLSLDINELNTTNEDKNLDDLSQDVPELTTDIASDDTTFELGTELDGEQTLSNEISFEDSSIELEPVSDNFDEGLVNSDLNITDIQETGTDTQVNSDFEQTIQDMQPINDDLIMNISEENTDADNSITTPVDTVSEFNIAEGTIQPADTMNPQLDDNSDYINTDIENAFQGNNVANSDDLANLFNAQDSETQNTDINYSETPSEYDYNSELSGFDNNNMETSESVAEIENYNDFNLFENSNSQNVNDVVSYESSNVITNQNIIPGEMPVDIDYSTGNAPADDLDILYQQKRTNLQREETPKTQPKSKKATMLIAAFAATAIIAASSAYYFMNNNQTKVNNSEIPSIPEALPPIEEGEQPIPQDNSEVITQDSSKANKNQDNAVKLPQTRPIGDSEYLSVTKLGWSIPDYLSYNNEFKNYLQTFGKSVKLALNSDLLLATEYPYSNQVFIDIFLLNKGATSDIVISKSSGSKQIDAIILRTVKETSNVIKAPLGVIVEDKFKMTLKIYL